MDVKVSIIIVNYKTSGLVVDCIRSVKEKTHGLSYEIIVVDNNSEPDIDATLNKQFGRDVICLKLNANLGFGLANNEGFKVSSGEYIFCLNPDTLLASNAVKLLADYLDAHSDVGAAGGNLFDADMQPVYSFYRVFPGIRFELYELSAQKLPQLLYRNNFKFNHTARPLDVAYITGADLMLRRDLWMRTGGFSDEFFMYFEETDLCARIHRLGHRIVCLPDAKIIHLEGASFGNGEVSFGNGEVSQSRYDMMERSRRAYSRRNMSKLEAKVTDLIYLFKIYIYYYIFRHKKHPMAAVYNARIKAWLFSNIERRRR